MNFSLSAEQDMLAATLQRYLSDVYPIDERHRVAYSAPGWSRAHWQGLCDLGVLAALFDERHGGLGGSPFDLMVVFENLGRSLVVEPVADSAVIVGGVLAALAPEAGCDRLEAVLSGRCVATLAHTEIQSGYDLNTVALRAERLGNTWRLSGDKCLVPFGASADAWLVSARTAGTDDDPAGITLFWLPRETDGVSVTPYALIDGGYAADLSLRNVELPAAAMLGEAGQAYPILERAISAGCLALCAEAVGIMTVVSEHTLEYLRTRHQFGVPIGSFQALQHQIADRLIDLEQARSSVILAASRFSGADAARQQAVAAAKYTIGQAGIRLAETCIQLHGGIGMTWELPLSHYAKRLVMIDHRYGDEDHHLSRYIALGR